MKTKPNRALLPGTRNPAAAASPSIHALAANTDAANRTSSAIDGRAWRRRAVNISASPQTIIAVATQVTAWPTQPVPKYTEGADEEPDADRHEDVREAGDEAKPLAVERLAVRCRELARQRAERLRLVGCDDAARGRRLQEARGRSCALQALDDDVAVGVDADVGGDLERATHDGLGVENRCRPAPAPRRARSCRPSRSPSRPPRAPARRRRPRAAAPPPCRRPASWLPAGAGSGRCASPW